MPSRRIEDLQPLLQVKARYHVELCEKEGVDLLIYCTLRTNEEQAALYSQGRTKPGKIVTYAKPGSSAHGYGLAYDAVPLFNGKALWKYDAKQHEWAVTVRVGRSLGLEWAGNWTKFREYVHWQIPGWRALVQ